MSRQLFIPNGVTIFGRVEGKNTTDKATVIAINCNDSAFPHVVLFPSAQKFADKVELGDFVRADCTVQEVKKANKPGPRTLACNRIMTVPKRDAFARFSIFGRPIFVKKVNDEEAFAIVKVVSVNGKSNYLRVNFYGTEDEVNEFMDISPNNFLNYKGHIETSSMRTNYHDKLVVETYRNVRPR